MTFPRIVQTLRERDALIEALALTSADILGMVERQCELARLLQIQCKMLLDNHAADTKLAGDGSDPAEQFPAPPAHQRDDCLARERAAWALPADSCIHNRALIMEVLRLSDKVTRNARDAANLHDRIEEVEQRKRRLLGR
ncbi:MAG: hypothetical protein V2A73_07980 [Pseudomonadota bacterium]